MEGYVVKWALIEIVNVEQRRGCVIAGFTPSVVLSNR